ncbi:hypothetical protein [Conyzicola sp.]|uniref:hypothetical protein n=1 Tax=Conyzicola sp. TaxID=1969404 RepID=UPI00398A1CBD
MPRRKTPLREQTFRIGGMFVGLLLGLLIVLVPTLLGRGPDLPPAVIAIVIGFALVIAIGGLALGLALGRRIVGERIEAALREPAGRWKHGSLTVTPGHLSFQPYRWQMRIPRGAPIEIDVDELGDDTGVRPPWKHVLSINPQLHIVTVASPQGNRELAALPSHLEELRERLSGAQVQPQS